MNLSGGGDACCLHGHLPRIPLSRPNLNLSDPPVKDNYCEYTHRLYITYTSEKCELDTNYTRVLRLVAFALQVKHRARRLGASLPPGGLVAAIPLNEQGLPLHLIADTRHGTVLDVLVTHDGADSVAVTRHLQDLLRAEHLEEILRGDLVRQLGSQEVPGGELEVVPAVVDVAAVGEDLLLLPIGHRDGTEVAVHGHIGARASDVGFPGLLALLHGAVGLDAAD